MSLFDLLPINGLNGAVNAAGDVVRDALGIGKTKSNATSFAKDTFEKFQADVFNTGLASESRYEVYIGTPDCILNNKTYYPYLRSTMMRVESVQFPAQMLQTKDRHTFGAPTPMPVGMDYGGNSGVSMTILMDRDMNSKKLFDVWMDSIVDYDTQMVAYPETYKTDVVISQLDKLDGTVYMIALEDAFPKIVSSMTGSAGSQNFQKVTVTFAYRRWCCIDWESKKSQQSVEQQQLVSKGGDFMKTVSSQINSKLSSVESGFKNMVSFVA